MEEPGSLASAIVNVEAEPKELKRVSFASPEKIIYVFPSERSSGCGGTIIRGILIAIATVLLLIILLNVPVASCLRKMVMQGESMTARQSDAPDNLLEDDVKKLEDSGWHLYTMPGCHFCEEQMEILGGSFKNRHICDQSSGDAVSIDECAGIDGYPCWKNTNTGEVRKGLQRADELRRM